MSELVEVFKYGKTQVGQILKKRKFAVYVRVKQFKNPC